MQLVTRKHNKKNITFTHPRTFIKFLLGAGSTTKHRSIEPILANQLCSGCGACSFICPIEDCITYKYGERYNFPTINTDTCVNCAKCLRACPSDFQLEGATPNYTEDFSNKNYECQMVYSNHGPTRFGGASGGFITELLRHHIESGNVDGAIVTKTEGDNPLVAESYIARDFASLFSARGSKYAPVSSCTALKEALEKPGRYIFVGAPCMVEGLVRLQKQLPVLKERIVLTVTFVCAGQPSREATKSYIVNDGKVSLKEARRISYRGAGWPGRFQVHGENGKLLMDRPLLGGSLRHVVGVNHPLKCELCLDHWGYFADIVVSDPWTKDVKGGIAQLGGLGGDIARLERVKSDTFGDGMSAIMIRKERGTQFVESALKSGCLTRHRGVELAEFIGMNEHLALHPNHVRHLWMAWHQLFFLGRIRYLKTVFRFLRRGSYIGIRTTLKALFARNYWR